MNRDSVHMGLIFGVSTLLCTVRSSCTRHRYSLAGVASTALLHAHAFFAVFVSRLWLEGERNESPLCSLLSW